ncbi:hypothetical protein CO641_12905 [Lysobacteraceae bacterium NML91-0213]|nr:hypothetical protein CO641_12905 [Xanthomonadaceae bacterium NML91-0213]
MPLLFRLLLCVTLLLNGIGSVTASVHVQLDALSGEPAAAPRPADRPDCGHASAAPADIAPAPAKAAPDQPADDVGDCMQLCMDLSLQPVQALAAVPALPPTAGVPAAPATRVIPGPASGPRPPPLRPPIAA